MCVWFQCVCVLFCFVFFFGFVFHRVRVQGLRVIAIWLAQFGLHSQKGMHGVLLLMLLLHHPLLLPKPLNDLLPNLVTSYCGRLPVWLQHKFRPKKKQKNPASIIDPIVQIQLGFFGHKFQPVPSKSIACLSSIVQRNNMYPKHCRQQWIAYNLHFVQCVQSSILAALSQQKIKLYRGVSISEPTNGN